MEVVDKVTVGWLIFEMRMDILREGGMVDLVTGCVVTVLLVSEVSRDGQEGVTEVSGIPVAKMEVGEVTWEGGWTTELVTELGKVT
jgi:hypothetical protein